MCYLFVVNEFIADLWEIRKHCKDACTIPQSDSSGWDQDRMMSLGFVGMVRRVN